jgi:cytoskeletal protein RodZ
MSTTLKIVLGVVVAVVVVGGIWWWVAASKTAEAPAVSTTQTQNMTPTSTAMNTSTPPAPSNGVSATDSSNAALQADLSNIDTQMNGFSSDNASVSQGMNDQPVQQSQL